MKTLVALIAVATLTSTTMIALADDSRPLAPVSPYAMTEAQQAAMAEQHKAFVEQQQAALQQAMEAQRQFAEQQAEAMRQAIEAQQKLIGESSPAPFAMPGMPEMPTALQLPARPDLASMDPETRRTEMRKYSEQVRQAIREQRDDMRKQMEERREAAKAEHAKYLEQMGRARPEV